MSEVLRAADVDLPEIPDIDQDDADPAQLGDLDDSLGPMPVDPPPAPRPLLPRVVESRPVVPPWLLDRESRRQAAGWAAKWAGHALAFHAVRSPLYSGKALALAPRGLGVTLRSVCRWAFDLDGRPVRVAAAANKDSKAWLALSRERNERVKVRLRVVTFGVIGSSIGLLVLLAVAPRWLLMLLALFAILVLAKVGQVPDKPIVSPAVSSGTAPRLTSGLVVRALTSIGLAGMTGSGKQLLADHKISMARVNDAVRDVLRV